MTAIETSARDLLDVPRVLVCTSYPFNTRTGGGITLRSLFQGWPHERLAQIYGLGNTPDLGVCRQYYALNASTAGGSPSLVSRAGRLVAFLLARSEVAAVWVRMTDPLQAFVRQFAPEIVFTQLGTIAQIRLALKVSRLAGVPLAVHIADDWASGFYQGPALRNRYLRRVMDRELRQALGRAVVLWGMSLPMARAFEARYGGEWRYLYNPVPVDGWAERTPECSRDGTFRLLYSGSIIDNAQKSSLRDVCDAVARLGAAGMKIEFGIYTFKTYLSCRADLERRPYVRLHESVPFDRLPAHLASADLLVLPVNFDRESLNYIRYSMPGKVSEYLLSGTPTLVYGPAEVVPVEYALRERWGYVVSRRGVDGVVGAVRALAANQRLRLELATRAREVGLRNHAAENIRSRFRQDLTAAVARVRASSRGGAEPTAAAVSDGAPANPASARHG